MPFVTTKQWAATHVNAAGNPWSIQYANRRIKDCGIPRNPDGLIDLAVADAMHAGEIAPRPSSTITMPMETARAAVAAISEARSHVESSEDAVDLTDLDRLPKSDLERLEIIENLRKKRLQNDENEGLLKRAEEVQRAWQGHLDAAKNRLLLLEAKVPRECQLLVKNEVRAALNELASYNPDAK